MSITYHTCPSDVNAALATGPFQQLQVLLQDITPPKTIYHAEIGEPQLGLPDYIKNMPANFSDIGWSKYPKAIGNDSFCSAITAWLIKRYHISADLVQHRDIIPLTGTREGLYMLAMYAILQKRKKLTNKNPFILSANPFYHVYKAAAFLHGADMVTFDTITDNGSSIIEQLQTIPKEKLQQCAAFFLNNPDNPTGYVYSVEELTLLHDMALEHDFYIIADECYSEIYTQHPPTGMIEIAQKKQSLSHMFIVNSLSKRSGGAGLRSGFAVVDPNCAANIIALRSHVSAIHQTPLLDIACALWGDEGHVNVNRAHYQDLAKIAHKALGHHSGFTLPKGGFFIWLKVDNGEQFTRALYAQTGVKVMPGRYMSLSNDAGHSPGDNYVRIAMVAARQDFIDIIDKMAYFLQKN